MILVYPRGYTTIRGKSQQQGNDGLIPDLGENSSAFANRFAVIVAVAGPAAAGGRMRMRNKHNMPVHAAAQPAHAQDAKAVPSTLRA